MKTKLLSVFLIFFTAASLLQAEKVDVQIAYGRWSLSPFLTLLERESEELIQDEISRLLDPILIGSVYPYMLSDVDFSSSGYFLSLAAWYNFGKGRLSAGLKAHYFNFRLPYSVYTEQSVDILGFPLVTIISEGKGQVGLQSMALSMLGRWAPILGEKLRIYLYGGVTLFPYQGDLSLEQKTVLKTPLGDLTYQGNYSHTIEEIREWNIGIPESIFSPSAGIQVHYRLLENVGVLLDASLAQGSFLSAGLFFSL